MPNTEEQRLDIIDNCKILLEGILQPFDQIDDTPEGRMITQLKWLKERAENHDLPLPVDKGMLATLLYIYTNGDIRHLASSQSKVREEVEIFMKRIIKLAKNANLLLTPPYYPATIHMIEALTNLLNNAGRSLDQHEQGLIPELEQLKQHLIDGKIEPPLMNYLPDYHNFNEVNMYKVSIDDLPDGKYLCKTVANLLFEGIRPDTWLTPEDAERITQNLPQHYL